MDEKTKAVLKRVRDEQARLPGMVKEKGKGFFEAVIAALEHLAERDSQAKR